MKLTGFEGLGAAAWAAVAGFSAARAAGVPDPGFSICPLRFATGAPCPGCGMGHALVDAFRGDWASSFARHPLGLPLLALWTAWLAWGLLNLRRGREFSAGVPRIGPRPLWAALALVLGVYALRLLHA